MFLALGFAPATPALAQEITQVNTVYSSTTAELILDAYAIHYGISMQEFVDTARCESGLRADAISPHDGHGGSRGVFQFQQSTFERYKAAAGVPNGDVFNPYDNIQVAAYMFSLGSLGENQWTCWRELQAADTS